MSATADEPSLAPPATEPPGTAALRDAAPARRPNREVSLMLRRLSRAVQRASIYPEDHPAVRQAVDSLVEAAAPLLRESTLSTIVARERLLAAHGLSEAYAYSVPWLSARLYDRGVASLTLDSALDANAARRLAQLLATPGRISDAEAATPVPGTRITCFDCSRARFREQPTGGSAVATEAEFVWGAIANALAADWCVSTPSDGSAPEPVDLADRIRASMASREGTGVTDLSRRVIAQGGRLAQLPEPVRAIVRQKLAAFVARLAPELRGQLLTAVPSDDPEKLALLVELVDALPSYDMLEVMQNVDLTTGSAPRQFLTLLRKLVTLAASEPKAAAAAEAAVDRLGLPSHLLPPGDSELRTLMGQLLSHNLDVPGWVPESYRQRIEELAQRLQTSDEYDLDDLPDLADAEAISAHVNDIALHLLRADPGGAGSAAYLRRLRDQAPRELDAGHLTTLGEIAGIIERLRAARRDLPAETSRLAQDYLTFCGQRHTVEATLAFIEQSGDTPDDAMVTLLRVGGPPAASAAVSRLIRSGNDAARDRLAAALVRLPDEIFKAAVRPRLAAEPLLARTVLGALYRVDHERGLELAEDLSTHACADVRLRGLELLFREKLTSARFDRLLRQALEDADPRVVAFGVDRACARRPTAGIPAMTAFLGAIRGPRFTSFQCQVVRLLADLQSIEARDALAAAIAGRRRAFDAPSRRVSVAIAAALDRVGDDAASNAVRAWRRSPAGLWSWLLHDAREGS